MVGASSPAMIHASVDLPDPLRPWISTPSPSWTTRSTSRSAVDAHGVPLPYSCPTPVSSSSGDPPRGRRAAVAAGAGAVRHHLDVVGGAAVAGQVDDPVGRLRLVVVVRDVHQRHPMPFFVSPDSTAISPSRPC